MRAKMSSAWDSLKEQQRTLNRANTVAAIARLFPGEQCGFKNANSMANTLRYYSTSFTREKTLYMQRKREWSPTSSFVHSAFV